MGEVLVEPEDVNAVEVSSVVELQRLGLLPGLVEAGAVERSRPERERVAGVVLFAK
ncbi:MAG: hypothetical protein ACRDHU_01995 [Actinomycetota bacterium]